jgi:heme/copper-type cytochrome/quinol oxidase subunit 3
MSAGHSGDLPLPLRRQPLPVNDQRGTLGIQFFIATEASLFAVLFATYWYMAKGAPVWPPDEPPKIHYALAMLVVLVSSSIVLHWGDGQIKKQKKSAGMAALAVTILLGIGFLILAVLEYQEHLKTLAANQDAYSSIFYMITTLHAAHVTLGVCMLSYIYLLPSVEPRAVTPHRPYHNVSLYWHFVDTVWVFIVLFLYVSPIVGRR